MIWRMRMKNKWVKRVVGITLIALPFIAGIGYVIWQAVKLGELWKAIIALAAPLLVSIAWMVGIILVLDSLD